MGSRKRVFIAALTSAILVVGAPARAQETTEDPPPPTLPAAPPVQAYTDIAGHWAERAIRETAYEHDWLRRRGTSFYPEGGVSRSQLAYSLVRAFARDATPDPAITFSDVPSSSSIYWYANVAVQRGFLRKVGTGFDPAGPVRKVDLAVALVRTLQLFPELSAINAISDGSGYKLRHPSALGYHTIAHTLRLWHNYPNAVKRELFPTTVVRRGEFAHALASAANAGWRLRSVERFRSIGLPTLTATRRKVVEYALGRSGFPYHYAGTSASTGYDCSGFVWAVMRAGSGPASRGYTGWSLPQRSSYEMARATSTRIAIGSLRPLDLLFWDVEGTFARTWNSVGHAGIYLGNGWFIHSSGGRAGVTLDWMGDGYWRDRFVWGRRIVPSSV